MFRCAKLLREKRESTHLPVLSTLFMKMFSVTMSATEFVCGYVDYGKQEIFGYATEEILGQAIDHLVRTIPSFCTNTTSHMERQEFRPG